MKNRYVIIDTAEELNALRQAINGLEIAEVDTNEIISAIFSILTDHGQEEERLEGFIEAYRTWGSQECVPTQDGEYLVSYWVPVFRKVQRTFKALGMDRPGAGGTWVFSGIYQNDIVAENLEWARNEYLYSEDTPAEKVVTHQYSYPKLD